MNVRKMGWLALTLCLLGSLSFAGGCNGEGAAAPEAPENQIIEDLNAEEAYALIQDNLDNPDFIILDVQSSDEYAERHMENAIHIPFYSAIFDSEVKKLDMNKKYLVYGRIGACGQTASRQMKKLGFLEVYSLAYGGLFQWERNGFPVVK